jgi:hypothetical protein
MSLRGELSTMPLPDLLQWLASAGKTGMLRVERKKLRRWIQFEDGRVVGCSSDDPPQRLGQFLLSRELITPEQLRQALTMQEGSGRHLGMTLVDLGYLSRESLAKHLEAKAEETIYSIFDWTDGLFCFEPAAQPNKNVFAVNLQVPDILLRGMKRFDDMQRIRQIFDDSTIVLRYTSLPPGPEIFQNRMARTMYSAIDGDRSIAEILLHVHGSEYIVYKFLFELHRNGYVEIAGRKQPEPPPESEESGRDDERRGRALPEFELEPDLDVDVDRPAALRGPDPASARAASSHPPPVGGLGAAAVETAPAPAAVSSSAGTLHEQLERAHHLMDTGSVEEALDLLDALYREQPGNESLRRLTAEAEAIFVQRANQHLAPPDKIPVLVKPVESLGTESLSPEQFFLLSRIDGSWNVKSIIQVSPMREVDALRTLTRMREAGMIELRDPE